MQTSELQIKCEKHQGVFMGQTFTSDSTNLLSSDFLSPVWC